MGLSITTSNKHGLGDSVSVDPKRSNGTFPPFSNLDKYLACRINEPSEFQSVEGTRFHPNCGWRVGENSKTKEIWQEFWTLRKIHKDEELTVDYGTAYPRAYATNKVLNEELYEHLHELHSHQLNRLGPNQVYRKRTYRLRPSGRSTNGKAMKKMAKVPRKGRRKQTATMSANGKAPRKHLATRRVDERVKNPLQNSLVVGLSESLETLVI
jgi:hypothetical protein